MNNKPIVISERIDDVVLLLNVMMQIGLPELLNRHLPRHWHQKGRLLGMGGGHLALLRSLVRRPPQSDGQRVGQSATQYARTSLWN